MKKFIFILFILVAITYLFLFKNNRCQNDQAKIYQINNKNYCLLTASNQKEWQKGLMFIKSKKELKGAEGMIFIFPNKQVRTFWNKNTYMDLDLYWMDDEKIVGKSLLQSINKSKEIITVGSKVKVNRVVEIIRY